MPTNETSSGTTELLPLKYRQGPLVPSPELRITLRAVIYCRISDDKMEDQAGVDRQEVDCRKICGRFGWEIVEVYIDNSKSAWKRNRKRPGWDALIERVRTGGVDVIVVYHPDRLMRQPRDLENLLDVAQAGVQLHGSVGEYDLSNSEDRFVLRIIVAQACKASDDASRRQKRKQKDMAEAGLWKGGSRPFGFEADGKTHRPSEVAVIRDLFERFVNGQTLRSVTAWLNASGVARPTAQGPWVEIGVRQMLASPRMAGFREFHGECVLPADRYVCLPSCPGQIFPAEWEKIVSVAIWRETVDLLGRNRQGWESRRETQRIFQATSLTKCSKCGSNMHSTGGGKVGYICLSRLGGCGKMHIGKDHLEATLSTALRARLEQSSLGATVRRIVNLDPEAEAQIREDQAQLAELAEAYGAKMMSMTEWMGAKKPIDERIKLAQRRMTETPTPLRLAKNITSTADWDATEPEERRAIYRELFEAIIIHPGTKGVFNPGRVEIVWAA